MCVCVCVCVPVYKPDTIFTNAVIPKSVSMVSVASQAHGSTDVGGAGGGDPTQQQQQQQQQQTKSKSLQSRGNHGHASLIPLYLIIVT